MTQSPKKQVLIYTDGGCIGNPGKGGFGAILLFGKHRKEISGGYRLTTNNRMEIMAALAALATLKEPCAVTVRSDSKYLVDAMTKGWVQSWQKRGWRKADKKPALNSDLWQQLLDLCKSHEVSFEWVKGHANIPENERCHELAQIAMQQNLAEDQGYLA